MESLLKAIKSHQSSKAEFDRTEKVVQDARLSWVTALQARNKLQEQLEHYLSLVTVSVDNMGTLVDIKEKIALKTEEADELFKLFNQAVKDHTEAHQAYLNDHQKTHDLIKAQPTKSKKEKKEKSLSSSSIKIV